MVIHSELGSKEYLHALRNRIDNSFSFGETHVSGFVLGKVFSVTYHSGYEYDRRYGNPKNSAIGYVRQTEDGCEARFLHTTGLLYPFGYLFAVLYTIAIYVFYAIINYAPELLSFPLLAGFGLLLPIVIIAIQAFGESFTDRSMDGAATLLCLMQDPKEAVF